MPKFNLYNVIKSSVTCQNRIYRFLEIVAHFMQLMHVSFSVWFQSDFPQKIYSFRMNAPLEFNVMA